MGKKTTGRRRSGCRRRGVGCFLLLLVLAALFCGAVIWLIKPPTVAADDIPEPLAVWLLIDNSNSMYEKGGIGSDPEFLRLDAARLFLSYLGVDEQDVDHQAAVIFFGTGADTAVPLTPLTNDQQRADLFAQIADPPRMGWTDHLAALQLAGEEIAEESDGRPVIILLTDGKPEWPELADVAAQTAYRNALQAQGETLAAAGIPLFIILLANETTAHDTAIAAVWQPLWQEMSQAVPPGRFFIAQKARDLLPIYHEIVAALAGEQTAGAVLETDVPMGGANFMFSVQPNLAQLTLVISKADPAQEVTVETAAGEALTPTSPHVRRAGGGLNTTEEVWVVEQPPSGDWTVRITGAGRIAIWQDYKLLPPIAAPSPTVAASTQPPTNTPPLSTATPKPLPTYTPTPVPSTSTPETASPERGRLPSVIEGAIILTPPEKLHPTAVKTTPNEPRWQLWTLGSLLFLTVVGGGVSWTLKNRQPRVSGALRILGGGPLPERVIDLDGMRKTAVTLGKPPSDIPLTGAEIQATISPGKLVNEVRQMLLSGDANLTLDDRRVAAFAQLSDSAIVNLGGGVRVRYENLRLRRAERIKN